MLLAVLLLAAPGFARAGGMKLDSPDFEDGKTIPARYTCQGLDISPRLTFSGVPAGAKSLTLVVEDPDAPGGTFTHWIVWNIPPKNMRLGEGGRAPEDAVEGTNDFGNVGYGGPCPPSGTHRYFFQLSALDTVLALKPGASRKDFDAAIKGHILTQAEYMGRCSKN